MSEAINTFEQLTIDAAMKKFRKKVEENKGADKKALFEEAVEETNKELTDFVLLLLQNEEIRKRVLNGDIMKEIRKEGDSE